MINARTIAIVDDDPSVRSGIGFLLRSFGYSAQEFASAEEFLQSQTLPVTSCVITDVKMPGMSGIELQQRLIADGYRFPIIFMTAFFEESLRRRVMSSGAHGFLAKPCHADALVNCVESALAA